MVDGRDERGGAGAQVRLHQPLDRIETAIGDVPAAMMLEPRPHGRVDFGRIELGGKPHVFELDGGGLEPGWLGGWLRIRLRCWHDRNRWIRFAGLAPTLTPIWGLGGITFFPTFFRTFFRTFFVCDGRLSAG